MLQPIILETEQFHVHSFRVEDIENYQQLAIDVLSVFSDPFTLKFVPDRRLHSLEEAEGFVKAMFINHHVGRNHLHFISSKKIERVIGIIDLISPAVAREHYDLPEYPYFIEFYLMEMLSGRSVMTEILPKITQHVHQQGIEEIGAVVNRNNKAAIKVLERALFRFKGKFDIAQDYYLVKKENNR
ncbi:MAG TPA: GNAT family N-acetyltransferase [Pseudosphingobacterium sp.]|nr:GNAT family N-acetyltransferase [Pseudosphingobacterium sp.]